MRMGQNDMRHLMEVLKVGRLQQRVELRREPYAACQAVAAIEKQIRIAELEEVATGSDLLRAAQRHEDYFPACQQYHLRRNDNKKSFDTQKNL